MRTSLYSLKQRHPGNRIFADLTVYMRRSPRLRIYAAPATVYLLVTFAILRSWELVAVLYASPVLILLGADAVFVRIADFYFPARRIFFLNFSTFTVFTVIAWVLLLLKLPVDNAVGILLFSWSIVSFLRSILYYPYYSAEPFKLFVPSLFPTIIASGTTLIAGLGVQFLVPALISSAIFFAFGIVFVHVSIRDFRREFGVSPIKVLNMFLNLRTEEEHAGLDFFRMIYGNERVVPVKVVSILKDNGRTVRLIFPYVHPGPFGKFGSSNLPEKLEQYLSGPDISIMVFHTATTNSNNCRDDDDVRAIAAAAEDAIRRSVEIDGISRFKKLSISGYSVGIQRIGSVPIISFIPDKGKFDDISLEDGLILTDALNRAATSDAVLIDAQSYFFHGAPILTELHRFQHAILREFERLETDSGMRCGYGNARFAAPGIGPVGVQALIIGNSKYTHCYLLTDSNNITTDLIKAIRERIPGEISSLEFYTTDNHVVNSSTLDMNPLGERDDNDLVAGKCIEAMEGAIRDLGNARVSYGASEAKVHMGEEGIFKRLNSTVFRAVKTAKYAIAATSLGSLAISGPAFFFLSQLL